MSRQAWFILESIALPVVVASLLVLGRRSTQRMILLLSVGALAFVGAKWLLLAVEFFGGAFQARSPVEPFLLVLDQIRVVMLTYAEFVGLAAWIVALVDAVAMQRWGWFVGILAVAVLSYVAYEIDVQPTFMRQIGGYDQLVRTHPWAVLLVLGTLAHVSAIVTLVYALTRPTKVNPS